MKAWEQVPPNVTNLKVTPIGNDQQSDTPVPSVQNVPPQLKQMAPVVLKQATSIGGSKAFVRGESSNTSAMQLDGMEAHNDNAQASGEISKGKEKEKWCFGVIQKAMLRRNVSLNYSVRFVKVRSM